MRLYQTRPYKGGQVAQAAYMEDESHASLPTGDGDVRYSCTYRERHDTGARGGHEGLRDFEEPPAAPAQLLPLLAPKLAVEALCYVSRQLYVLLLVRACMGWLAVPRRLADQRISCPRKLVMTRQAVAPISLLFL